MQTWVVEGNHQHLDGGAMFGNAPKALWSRWVQVDVLNRIPLACRTLLVQTDKGKNILFEAGIGNFFDPKLKERYGIFEKDHELIKNLSKIGFVPEDIDAIILSHLHFDHAGGLLTSYGEKPALVFPRATVYVGHEHWGRALNPHQREKISFIPQLHQLLKDSKRLRFVEEITCSELGMEVFFHYSHGHTIGLVISEIHLDDGPLYFVSDLIPGVPWIHGPITMGYDRFPELTVDEKLKLLERAEKENARLFFTHDPSVSYTHVARNEEGHFKPKNSVSINGSHKF